VYHIKSVLGQKAQPELIHTLGAPHFKEHCRFLRKLKDFKCALWSEKYGKCSAELKTDYKLNRADKLKKTFIQMEEEA